MARVKTGIVRRRRHRAQLARVTGFRLKRKNVWRRAKEALLKAGPYAYAHRRLKKRDRRRLWNIQINAAARANGTTYRDLIHNLKNQGVTLNRPVLAQIAQQDPAAFAHLVAAPATPAETAAKPAPRRKPRRATKKVPTK